MTSYRRFVNIITGLFVGCTLLLMTFVHTVYAIGSSFRWQAFDTATSPGPNWLYGLSYDSAREVTVLFGGQPPAGTFLNNTWEFDGTDWRKITTATSPEPRISIYNAQVYDSGRKKTVLFGGLTGSGYADDTWEYDGVNWKRIQTPQSPPGRDAHSMVYDSKRQRVVLFGGCVAGPCTSNDTWEYDGSNWRQINTAQLPPSRIQGTLVYDSQRGVSVLFGGRVDGASTIVMNDTWEYNGTNWQQVFPNNKPSARSNAAMDYDSTRKVVVLFGGQNANYLSDMWEYNGINWTEVTPSQPTPSRLAGQMVYDAKRKQMVRYGGKTQGGPTHEGTWLYREADSVLLVHGWNGGPGLSGSATCSNTAMQWSKLTPNQRTLGELGSWFNEDGYEVWYAFLDTNFVATPSFQQNATCLKKQILSVWQANGNRQITIVAHSMGGAVTRWCVQDQDCAKAVSTIVTYGTPHEGTVMADLKKAAIIGGGCSLDPIACATALISQSCLTDGGACDMDPMRIRRTNPSHPNLAGIEYYFVGGAGVMFGDWDGTVTRTSALALSPESTNEPSGWAKYVKKRYTVSEKHTPWLPSTLNAYYEPSQGRRRSHAYYCTLDALTSSVEPYPTLCLNAVQIEASTPHEPTYSNSTPAYSAVVESGQTITRQLTLDGNGDAMFVVGSFGESLDWQVIDPTGIVYDNPVSNTLVVNAASAGIWHVVVSNSNASQGGFGYFAYYNSPVHFNVVVDSSVHKIGETVQFTAVLTSSTSITDVLVTAHLATTDGTNKSVVLVEQSPGTYSAAYSLTAPAGQTFSHLVATGWVDGNPFVREYDLVLTSQDTSKSLGDLLVTSYRDDDGDNYLDTFVITQEVKATHVDGQIVTVRAKLSSNNGEQIDTVDITPVIGLNSATLEFPLSALGSAGLAVQLTEIMLLDSSGVSLETKPMDRTFVLPDRLQGNAVYLPLVVR